MELTQPLLQSLLRYDADSGKLFWNTRPRSLFVSDKAHKVWNTQNAGKQAFTASSAAGYKVGRIFGKGYLAHRIIWCMVYGDFVKDTIDHINQDPSDNRLENLREATKSENRANSRSRLSSKLRLKGVYWSEKDKKYVAEIIVSGKKTRLGYFRSADEAAHEYNKAAIHFHGEYAALNPIGEP